MTSAVVYVVLMDVASNPMPIPDPTFSPSLPFVSIDFEGKQIGNPPQLAVPGGASWLMGVQQGTVITVSAPGFAATVVDSFASGVPFVGTDPETPIEAKLSPQSAWWTWTSPTPLATNTSPAPGLETTAAWKAMYSVGGTLQNFDPAETITAELALTQTGPWASTPSGAPSSLVATQSVSVPPGLTVPVILGSFTQGWQWFEQATGALTGPTSMFVSYPLTIAISYSTGFGFNTRPPDLIVDVSVAQWKVTDQQVAEGAFATEAVLSVASILGSIWPPAGVAIATALLAAQATETGEAAAANDPPEPSLAFDHVEQFQPPTVSGPEDRETNNLRELFTRALAVAEARRVLSITQGRLDGARRVGTEDDINRQLEHYHRVVSIVTADSANVAELGVAADREFAQLLERLKSAVEGRPEIIQLIDRPEIVPPGVVAPILRAARTLDGHPEITTAAYNEAVDKLADASSGVFAKLAVAVGEAMRQMQRTQIA
jgi:hypothetical protein